MPQSDFFSTNLRRAYPLVESAAAIQLYPLLVDIKFTIRGTSYRHSEHSVQLLACGQLDATQQQLFGPGTYPYYAVFGCDLPLLKNQAMLFSVPNLSRYQSSQGRLISLYDFQRTRYKAVTATLEATRPDIWQGWAMFGDTNILSSLADYTASELIKVEPARVRNVVEPVGGNTSGNVRVYNQNRTHYDNPTGCEHIPPVPQLSGSSYIASCGPLTGIVRLGGGSQVLSNYQASSNSINFNGEIGGGDTQVSCGTIPLTESEPRFSDRDYDGAPRCSDVLRRINGVPGPDVRMRAAAGVNIAPFPDLNRVVIAISGETLVECPDFSDPQPVTYLPTDDNGNPCGDGGAYPPRPGDVDGGSTTTAAVGATRSVDPIQCGGSCRWVANNGTWLLADNPCNNPCDCEYPSASITQNYQTAFTACLEVDAPDDNPIRNADFAETNPFSAWRRTGEVTLVNSFAGLPDSEFPLAQLSGDAATLGQDKIRVVPRRAYYLFADVWVVGGGEITVRVTDLDGQPIMVASVDDAQYRNNLYLGKFSTTENGVNIEVVRSAQQPSQSVALIGRLTLTTNR